MLKSRFISAALLVVALLMTSGCAVNRATGMLTPGTDLAKVKTFYVVKAPTDGNKIDELIKAQLVSKGFAVTVGPEQTIPYKADAVVTYIDKWMWDLSMYMIELTITLRDPTSNFPMAVGNSFHTSLSRKSPEAMVDEVLGNIFTAPKPANQ